MRQGDDAHSTTRAGPAGPAGTAREVFATFLKLGLTAFGGPVAHLGYFRQELVLRRRWLDEAGYADLVALAQFLPGPASSQVGFALGLFRAGWPGALAAWAAFTLPSAILLVIFAFARPALSGPLAASAIHGLKLVAVAVVAQAVVGMARTLTPDRTRAAIAVAAVIAVAAFGAAGQLAAIAAGGLLGLWLCRDGESDGVGRLARVVSKRTGATLVVAFFVLLIGAPVLAAATGAQGLRVFDAFYRSGALVFGGGHVVLPLLQAEVVPPGWIGANDFLAGYGAAQAVPGPLFTFAAYLGAAMEPSPNGVIGAALALVAMFLPGLLLVAGVLPFWDGFRQNAGARAAMRGTNAAVVGILGAALYDPVFTGAIGNLRDFAVAFAGFVALTAFRAPSWLVVIVLVAASAVLAGWA